MALIERSLRGMTGILLLNRPEKKNSLNAALIAELARGLGECEKQDARALVLRAAPGAKVWSAGYDINELPEPGQAPGGCFRGLEKLLEKIRSCPVPVIAMVEGSVWGGGCDLCFACDMVVAARGSSFAMTPAKIGVPYHPTGLARIAALAGVNKAREMLFTAQPVTAEDAWSHGFVNHVVPPGELESFTLKLADSIAANAPLVVRALKEEFRLLLRGPGLDAEAPGRVEAARRAVYDSADYAEGLRAFKEKRPARWSGK